MMPTLLVLAGTLAVQSTLLLWLQYEIYKLKCRIDKLEQEMHWTYS